VAYVSHLRITFKPSLGHRNGSYVLVVHTGLYGLKRLKSGYSAVHCDTSSRTMHELMNYHPLLLGLLLGRIA